MLTSLTSFCLRHRVLVIAVWAAAVVAGTAGALRLGPLLGNGFSLPGTDSARVQQILQHDYGDPSGSPFVLIAEGKNAHARVDRAAQRAVTLLPHARVDETRALPSGGAAAFVVSALGGNASAASIPSLRRAAGPGVLVTGDAAIQHDLAPVLARDLRVGELYVAVPAALVILALVFGTASAILPFVFALATIPPALGIAWGAAHLLQMSDYLRNMVLMIGLGIAIDYSLLVVHRYRDEREAGRDHVGAVHETVRHATRTIVFSGLAVSLGLALMLLLPVPMLRSFGLGGLLVPLVSVVCAVTLLPVLLLVAGERLERVRFLPRGLAERRRRGEHRLWSFTAHWVMRHARVLTAVAGVALLLAALPAGAMRVGPSSTASLPPSMPATAGLDALQHGGSAGSLDPMTVVVDTHRADGAATALPALHRLDRLLARDPEVASVSAPVRDRTARYLEVAVVDRHDPAGRQAQALASRLRDTLIPAARFPASARVIAGGGGAYSDDYVSRILGSFPWLVLGVLALTYLLLVRAFRSLLLPLKAILLNLLTVSAATGVTIAVFQWGWGRWAGLLPVPQIEGWIPVFMFALLFGLSMDYEVFLVSRMREAWDRTRSNSGAVVHGLTSTGRIVTAAGLIMAATFGGLALASIPTMQQLGFGLAVAIAIDITLVRGILLPSTMTLAGRWNWYLPAWAARAMRLRLPS